MGKGYKGVACAYCVEREASTADHVIAREFFPKDSRGNLPKVPACADCNNAKSKLEHLLTAVMPFGARHSGAGDVIARVETRLAKNQRLHRTLADGHRVVLRSTDGGAWVREMTIPLEGHTLEQLSVFIVKGLAHYHWKLSLGPNHSVRASFLNAEGRRRFDPFFEGHARANVQGNFSDGVFTYQGIQSLEEPDLTMWRMSIYGVEVGGDQRAPGERATTIYGFSAPKGRKASEALKQMLGAA